MADESEIVNNIVDEGDKDNNAWIYIVIGFTSLGLLVGSIAGLSEAQLTIPLFGFLFSFVGGSLMVFFGKIPRTSIIFSCIALTSFSLAMTLALYFGLFIKVNEVLFSNSEKESKSKQDSSVTNIIKKEDSNGAYRALLRSEANQKLTEYLTEEIKKGNITLLEACERLMSNNNKGTPTK